MNSVFTYGYGVHFTTNTQSNNSNIGSKKSFVLFTDVTDNKDNKFYNYSYNDSTCGTPDAENECLEILNITSQDQISSISYKKNNDDKKLLESNESLDIVFKRPNSEPIFCYKENDHNYCKNDSDHISYVEIVVSSIKNQNISRTITIFNNGQIGVK
jgi:hypothetical protein